MVPTANLSPKYARNLLVSHTRLSARSFKRRVKISGPGEEFDEDMPSIESELDWLLPYVDPSMDKISMLATTPINSETTFGILPEAKPAVYFILQKLGTQFLYPKTERNAVPLPANGTAVPFRVIAMEYGITFIWPRCRFAVSTHSIGIS